MSTNTQEENGLMHALMLLFNKLKKRKNGSVFGLSPSDEKNSDQDEKVNFKEW